MKQFTVMACILAVMLLAVPVGAALGQTPIIQYDFNESLANSGSLGAAYDVIYQDGSAGMAEFEQSVYGYGVNLTNGDFSVDGDRFVVPFELSSITSGTMSFWLKENALYNYNSIVSCAANKDDWEMFAYNNESAGDRVKVRLDSGVVSTNPETCMQGFGNSWWNHYTFTWNYDGTTTDIKLYLNGKLDQWYDMESTSSWITSGSEFYLGGGPSGTSGSNDYGTWSMDDFRLYNTALSASEAFDVYQERNETMFANAFASSGTAVVRYEFNDTDIDLASQPNAVLNSGSYSPEFPAELYNGAGAGNIVFINDPERGKVLKIEQIADALNQESSYHLQSDYTLGGTIEDSVDQGTISFWLKVNEFNELGTIFDSADGREWEAFVFDDGHIRFAVGGDAYTTVQLGDYGDGQDDWHHVTFRWMRGQEGDNGMDIDAAMSHVSLWCFIDGEEADYDEGSWAYGEGEMSIGGLSPNNPGGNFLMDNFSIFEVALDDAAIKAIYDAEKVVVTPKIPGDANNDKKVDGSDVTILAGNWQILSGATWEMGDFNGDGKVDGSDVTILAGNWQYGVNTAAAAVPEPSTIALLISALAGLGLFLRRR